MAIKKLIASFDEAVADCPPAETVGVLPFVQNGPPNRTRGRTFEKTFALAYCAILL